MTETPFVRLPPCRCHTVIWRESQSKCYRAVRDGKAGLHLRNLTEGTVAIGDATDVHGDEDDVDGCDVEFQDSDATLDTELPPATGGVTVVVPVLQDGEDDLDGCDLEFDDDNPTRDEDLPEAIGGVA